MYSSTLSENISLLLWPKWTKCYSKSVPHMSRYTHKNNKKFTYKSWWLNFDLNSRYIAKTWTVPNSCMVLLFKKLFCGYYDLHEKMCYGKVFYICVSVYTKIMKIPLINLGGKTLIWIEDWLDESQNHVRYYSLRNYISAIIA